MGVCGVEMPKEAMIDAIRKARGNLRRAAVYAGCAESTMYSWQRKFPDFAAIVEEERAFYRKSLVDLAEDKLEKKIEEEDLTAIIFALKTQGRKQGYSQQEMDSAERIIELISRGSMDRKRELEKESEQEQDKCE